MVYDTNKKINEGREQKRKPFQRFAFVKVMFGNGIQSQDYLGLTYIILNDVLHCQWWNFLKIGQNDEAIRGLDASD